MELIITPPIDCLHTVEDQPSYLLLMHLMKYEQYRKFFENKKDRYLILDNSAFECGEPQVDEMEKWVEKLEVDEVVAPDVLYDAKETYLRSKPFLERFKRAYPHIKVMGVIQGKSMKETRECIRRFLDLDFDVLAVPKWGAKKFARVPIFAESLSRYRVLMELLEYMDKYKRHMPIHILGVNDPEIEIPAFKTLARSIDTTWPFKVYKNFSLEKRFPKGLLSLAQSRIEYLKSLLKV